MLVVIGVLLGGNIVMVRLMLGWILMGVLLCSLLGVCLKCWVWMVLCSVLVNLLVVNGFKVLGFLVVVGWCGC